MARLTPDLALGSVSVPTLSEWALFVMIALLLMTGLVAVRHRRPS